MYSKDVTRLSPLHYHPFLACSILRFVTNRAYMRSFGTASWTAYEFGATDSVCYASFGVRSYYSTPFAAKWNVRKASIALFTLDWKPEVLAPQWCDERRTWRTEWNDILFIDESFFRLQHHDCRIRVWRHRGERLLSCCVMHHHIGPAYGIMVWGGIGFHCRTPLVRIAGTLNCQRYISELLEHVVLTYILRLLSAIFQQDNARPHEARNVLEFFTL
ncbi:uncharacterized protein TNCV_3057071 [Trichonephila clavipes]|nr:uncharacterized protein TNCV_3057071 [Trichonephila clavipes]